MLHSIATVSISGTLEEKLRVIANSGFAGVEILESDLLTFPGSAREVGRMVADLGMTCTTFQPFRDFEGMPGDLRQRTFDRLERKFDVAQELGTDLLFICSNVSNVSTGHRQRIVDDLSEAGERAAKRGMQVGYEALSWGKHVFDHRDAWSIIKAVDRSNVRLILDSFHSLARRIPCDSILDIDPDRIALVQIADAPYVQMDELSWSRHFRCMPGQGEFPLVDFVGALADIRYQGPLSLEIFNDRFRAASASQIAEDGRRSLIFLEDKVAQRRGESTLPARAQCHGVEFLEFTAGEEEAQPLKDLLAGIGFRHVAQHKRKAVSLWGQGDIRIVVNCEKEGFAHAHDLLHGCSVCAVGLRTEASQDVLQRAQALRITSFAQPVAPGEFEIPAVRSVGGSLIYFVDETRRDSIWHTEFASTGVNAPAGPLQRVDHIAQSVPFEQMQSWLLFYTSLIEVEPTEPLEIPDPLGLVQSQAVANAERSLRVTINASAARDTLASRFLSSYLGAGVQHVAFSTHDIYAAAGQLAKAGVEMLQIPEPYYDDLQARFGLKSDFVNHLKRLNILYDQDHVAEYFQIYTRAFAKRFFFEIVERRGYDGYGAANAAVRLAAQSRFQNDVYI